MSETRQSIAKWVSREILPHEAKVRAWLARRWGAAIDVDDIIQEAYCRISALTSVDHIDSGRAYFFKTANSVAVDSIRRVRVVNAGGVTENALADVMDEDALPDRVVEAQQELARVDRLLSNLSWTGRKVIELRRIHGLSQRETARQLGISESVVENHIARGLKAVLRAMTEEPAEGEESGRKHLD